MYLSELFIEGYKNFGKKTTIKFHHGLNVIVGENGVGKTAVVDAVRSVLIEDEFGRRSISDIDFFGPFKEGAGRAKLFRIEGKFEGLSKNEKVAFLPWTDLEGKASLTLLVENKPNKRGRYKHILWGGASKASMFERELFDVINCIYLPPLRDAEAKLREGRSSRLARLLKNLNKESLKAAKEKNTLHPLEERVKELNKEISSEKNRYISAANDLIRGRLLEAIGNVFGQDTHIQFSETNFNRIVESLRLFFFPEANTKVPKDLFRSLEENSLGYNNLLYLATVLAELTDKSDTSDYYKVLLIEEPEAHLHPQLQVRFLKYLEKTATDMDVQIIVTTHSPVLASSASLDSLIHMSSSLNAASDHIYTTVPLKSCGLGSGSKEFISRWLDATKSILLFAKGVILVEGIAEAMLIPELAKKALADYNDKQTDDDKKLPESLIDCGVSVINMNGIYFSYFMQLFCNIEDSDKDSIPILCSGITDNDPPKKIITDGKEVPTKPTPSNPMEGTNHALKLINKINKSTNTRLYANLLKTFEYDLAMEAGNMNVMIPVAKSLLDTDGDIKKTFEANEGVEWEHEQDEIKKAEAAYYLLDHIEKGIFSQALADHLVKTKRSLAVPSYIYNAVIWACGGEFDDA